MATQKLYALKSFVQYSDIPSRQQPGELPGKSPWGFVEFVRPHPISNLVTRYFNDNGFIAFAAIKPHFDTERKMENGHKSAYQVLEPYST